MELVWTTSRTLTSTTSIETWSQKSSLAFVHRASQRWSSIDPSLIDIYPLYQLQIFSQMVYLNGFFHADPHQGNVLIRPRPVHSRSPYNFEVVLLDHGQYFDLDDQLRGTFDRLEQILL